MKIQATTLQDLYVLTPEPMGDDRGFLMEVLHKEKLKQAGIPLPEFVQMNVSRSQKGVVRGLHFQWDKPLGKYIRVINGRAFVVAVDLRKKSDMLGKYFSVELSFQNRSVFWVPFGFAFGFSSLEDGTELEYLYTAHYNPSGESNILWNDPDIGIIWPVKEPILSKRDQAAGTFQEWLARSESDLLCRRKHQALPGDGAAFLTK